MRSLLLTLLFLLTGGVSVWGQGYSGTWYIANNTSYSSYSANNYYMVPAADPQKDNYQDAFYYSATNGDPEMPFLTTFKTNRDYNSVWKITATGDGYYYIQHWATGKYVVYEPPTTSNNNNRKSMHLLSTDSPGENAKFDITPQNTTGINIRPISQTGNSTNRFFNPAGSNNNYYYGSGGSSGGSNYQGLIGLWSGSDGSSIWYHEKCSLVICYDTDNKIKITSFVDGATVYYTTDGTTPSSSNGTAYSAPFTVEDDVTTIKAVAVKGDDTSEVVEFTPLVLLGSDHIRLIQSQNNAWNTTELHFYMIPGDNNKANTTSLFRPSMQWYFSFAGFDGSGWIKYYIVNSTGKNLCYDSTNKIYMDSYSTGDAEKFMFRITESPIAGTYNIIPCELYTGNRIMNKPEGNDHNNDVSATTKDKVHANSRWDFVLPTTLDKNAPFNVSNGSTSAYYKILNNDDEGYYIAPPATGTEAIVSNSEDPEVVKTMNWYFEKAEDATSDDWLTYYYIRNAVTGDYLYYKNGNPSNNNAAFDLKSDLEVANKERYLFTWARTTEVNKYFIIPKMLKDETQNNISTLNRNNSILRVQKGRSVGAYSWSFIPSTDFCVDPVITQDINTGNIIINCLTPGADIYYTTDGSDPVVPATGAEPTGVTHKYTAAFLPELDVIQIKAIAALASDHEATSSIVTFDLTNCDIPAITFDYTTGNVTIISAIPGATIFYTIAEGDNTPADPTVETETYGINPVTIPLTAQATIKAIATRQGWLPSDIAETTIYQVATPSTEITSDGKIRIICSTPNVSIYYTIGNEGEEIEDPTPNSTRYTGALDNMSGKVIKAIAVKAGWLTSNVYTSSTISFQCATPIIRREVGNTFSISCSYPTTGVSIYYTTDGSTPTTGSTLYDKNATNSITSFPFTINAIAVATGYENSEVATQTITEDLPTEGGYYLIASAGDFEMFVSQANTETGAAENYRVTADFTVNNPAAITRAFTGTFDGGFYTITGMNHTLFNSINGGTVKNVVLDAVSIDTDGNAGAICNEADGATKIYNCGVLSGSVEGDDYVGGLVGLIKSGSSVRVVNCYNFAEVKGGTTMAGVVGYNQGTVGNVRIAMCMMYGEMSGGKSPVYAGNHLSNVQDFTEYNYWRTRSGLTYSSYKDQLAIDKDEDLTRFPFYRHIMNTHRELAAYFLFAANPKKGTGGSTVDEITDDEKAEIGVWVLKRDVAPYPIIEGWEANTRKVLDNSTPPNILTEMGNGGYLTVNVSVGGASEQIQLPITDMDERNFDYTWGKVVLPFANEFSGWTRDYSKVCTGWKITGVNGGTAGTFEHYNVADRDCTAKDLYGNTDYIFAQGGYYTVPYGVTSIDIEAHFANAFYLSDPQYEVGYNTNFEGATSLGGQVPGEYHGQTVYTSLSSLVEALGTTNNPHDQAIVLVGNFHYRVTGSGNVHFNTGKAVTIMSTDEDNNQEPDYGWYQGNTYGRLEVPPIRFDFLPIIEMGMSSRVGAKYPAVGIWHARGWFELTETCVSKMIQCEINSDNFTDTDNEKGNNRWIANSGYFTQIVRARDGNCTKLSYIQIGGNAYVKELYPGSHTDNGRTCTAVPIAVTGGEVEECYMTGYCAKGGTNGNQGKLNGDIYFWCTGGKIGKFLGAYLEEPVAVTGTTAGLTAKIDHAIIGRFFGGGTSASARIKGNIDITINNSHVDFYCGGPEFGDMYSGKTVTTRATNTVFGEYYGAGFGGTSITYNREEQNNDVAFNGDQLTYPLAFTYYTNNRLQKKNYGIGTCYKFEYIYHSNGSKGVARFYTGYAQFSLATTGNVTNELNDCTIESDFYGAGCQGKVDGTVTSTLTGCTINGRAFGGGFKAESNELDVYPETQPTYSIYTKETGIFSDFGTVAPETFYWAQGDATTENTVSGTTIYTSKDIVMADLGNVTGAITLNIEDGTKILGRTVGDETIPGHVFGGGNESKSLNNTTVNINGGTISSDVYGGGNQATVGGGTTVNLHGGTINHNVFGGGRGVKGSVAADVGGNVLVTLNETPTITGGVPSFPDNCVVKGDIFGCNNYYGSPKGSVTVHVYKTQGWAGHNVSAGKADDTIEKTGATYEVHAVYGGGNEAAYVPDPDVSTSIANVIIDGCTLTSIEYVYGGGNAAPAPGTHVTVNSCYEIGTVFGGGNGLTNLEDGSPNPGANVGYKTFTIPDDATDEEIAAIKEAAEYGTGISYVELKGGTIHKAFGGSNTKGNIRVKGTVDLNEPTPITCPLEVEEVYGAGNEAEQDGSSEILLGCISYLKEIYGGARKADINNNVVLTIQSGRFDRVFGGNNLGGKISGTITVNIEETGCHPIIIGQLFGGGNQAAYTAPSGQHGPTVNVKSFTSIGEIYGGGYGETAVVKGDTYININECIGDNTSNETTETVKYTGKWINYDVDIVDGQTVTQKNITLYQPAHTAGAIGTIGNVFGGGNEAKVDGSTNIHIGLLDYVPIVSYDPTDVRGYYTRSGAGTQANPYTYGIVTGDAAVAAAANTIYYKPVTGVNITGNVYGGGNAAEVTGDTNVLIGTEEPTTNP